jgi:tol-pal system protein YbgF
MKKSFLKKVFATAVLSSMAVVAFADDAAPVYDADNYPPAFDGQSDAVGQASPAPGPTSVATPSAPPLTIDQRIARAETQINSMQSSNSNSKMEEMRGEIQALRNQVEELRHELQQAQKQQTAMYSDLDKRFNKKNTLLTETDQETRNPSSVSNTPDDTIPSKPVVPPTPAKPKDIKTAATAALTAAPKAAESQPNVAEEQQIYQTAYNLIKAKKYNEAVNSLQGMLKKYPTGQFAANAHYWLGELYGLMGNNAQSAEEFGKVVNNFPDSPKIADAQLKLGLTYASALKWAEAKSAFKKVVSRYPGTASARLAAEQIKQIQTAGH